MKPEDFLKFVYKLIINEGLSVTGFATKYKLSPSALHMAISYKKAIYYPTNKRILDAIGSKETVEQEQCPVCNKFFYKIRENQQCCGKQCHVKHKNYLLKIKKTETKERKKHGLSLQEVVVLAEQAGMTYGQYVATQNR
jgi:predicted transcriptional regulator